MAVVASNTVSGTSAPVTLTVTTLGASDTLNFASGTGQILHLHNSTGGSLTLNIDGSTATTVSIPGAGGATLDVSTGFNIIVAAGARKAVRLDSLFQYLKGTVALTGASGLTAYIEV